MNIRIVIIIFVKGIRSFISKQGKPAVRELALKNIDVRIFSPMGICPSVS